MTETALAAGDLITAIPSLWQSLQIPLAIIAICVGGVAGAVVAVEEVVCVGHAENQRTAPHHRPCVLFGLDCALSLL